MINSGVGCGVQKILNAESHSSCFQIRMRTNKPSQYMRNERNLLFHLVYSQVNKVKILIPLLCIKKFDLSKKVDRENPNQNLKSIQTINALYYVTPHQDILRMTEIECNSNLAELLSVASKHKAIVVDFHATWCGPCKRIAPYLHQKCQEAGVVLVKVDVDQNAEAAQKYGIQAMPTFKVLDSQGNALLTKTGGANPVVDEIVKFAASHK